MNFAPGDVDVPQIFLQLIASYVTHPEPCTDLPRRKVGYTWLGYINIIYPLPFFRKEMQIWKGGGDGRRHAQACILCRRWRKLGCGVDHE